MRKIICLIFVLGLLISPVLACDLKYYNVDNEMKGYCSYAEYQYYTFGTIVIIDEYAIWERNPRFNSEYWYNKGEGITPEDIDWEELYNAIAYLYEQLEEQSEIRYVNATGEQK